MHEAIEFLKGFNIQTLLGMGLMFWFFSRHIDSKFAAMEARFEKRFDAQSQRADQLSQRADKLYEMFIDLLKERKS